MSFDNLPDGSDTQGTINGSFTVLGPYDFQEKFYKWLESCKEITVVRVRSDFTTTKDK